VPVQLHAKQKKIIASKTPLPIRHSDLPIIVISTFPTPAYTIQIIGIDISHGVNGKQSFRTRPFESLHAIVDVHDQIQSKQEVHEHIRQYVKTIGQVIQNTSAEDRG
jgi:hypothetical protein